MRKPNFIIAGVMKSGSTSIYHYISQHPQIFMPSEKEPDYFNYNYSKGEEWYLSLFNDVNHEKAIGEASVRMFNMYDALKKLKKFNPDIKLIFIFRNPVERVFSNYMYDLSKGLIRPHENFSEIIRDKSWRWYNGYVDLGHYYKHCCFIEKLFPKENILYTFHDNLKSNPLSYCKSIFTFLEVNDSFIPTANMQHNTTVYPNSISQLKIAYKVWEPMRNIIVNSKLKFVLDKTLYFRGKIKDRLFYNKGQVLSMLPDDRTFLIDLYSESIDKLQHKLETDLSHWLI